MATNELYEKYCKNHSLQKKKRPLVTLFKRHYSLKKGHQSLGVIYSASFAKCCRLQVWKFF
jgi:hypothetical protein